MTKLTVVAEEEPEMELTGLMQLTVADVEAAAAAVCVGEHRQTEPMELVKVVEVTVTDVEAETLRLPLSVVSVSMDADRRQ